MKLGLIGTKLSHSFSKDYFEKKFNHLNLENYTYELFELESIDSILSLIEELHLDGFNVTVPFKEAIIPFIDNLDETAEKVGAVNTVKVNWENNKPQLTGYNTDVFGFEQMVKPYIKNHHERALILGTGGASKAVNFVLEKKGIKTLFVSRTKQVNNITYQELNDYVLKFHPLIVNTTPVGMYPQIEEYPPIPYNQLTLQHTLIDLIYNPEETLFLKKGKEMGTVTLNGTTMLHQQAEKAWTIWTN